MVLQTTTYCSNMSTKCVLSHSHYIFNVGRSRGQPSQWLWFPICISAFVSVRPTGSTGKTAKIFAMNIDSPQRITLMKQPPVPMTFHHHQANISPWSNIRLVLDKIWHNLQRVFLVSRGCIQIDLVLLLRFLCGCRRGKLTKVKVKVFNYTLKNVMWKVIPRGWTLSTSDTQNEIP